jgi:uncharacterized protein involved in outer membrane biogenesis
VNWRKVSLWSLGGVLALLLIATSALFLVDLGIFKPQIEQWVSDKTGRHFTIEGQFEVSLGGQSVVVAKDVRLANANWSDDAYMLELGYVEVRVNTLSLLAGRIEIDLIRLDDTSIRLERIDDITPNWELIAASPDAAKTSGDEKINWLVRQIDIERLHVVYLSPDRTGPLDLRIERLSQQHRDDDYLELTMDASIGERDVSLTAEAGTWNALLEQKDVEYELRAQLDTLVIESKGRIDDLIAPRKPVLSFSAKGPDVNNLARLLQIPERGEGDINLSGSLAAPDNGNLVLSVDGNLGRIQAEGAGYFSDLQDLEQFAIDLDVSGPDVGHILGFMGIQQLLGVAFELNLRAERQGPMVIVRQAHLSIAEAGLDLSAHLPEFPSLANSRLHFEIVGERFEQFREVLKLPGGATGPYSLAFDLNLSEDGVEVLQLDIESSLLKLEADGQLSSAPNYVGSELQLEAELKSLADISAAYGFGSFSDRPLTIKGRMSLAEGGIETRGPVSIRSRDLVANVDGFLALTAGVIGSDLSFQLGGSSLAALADEFASIEYIPAEAYELEGRVQLRPGDYRLDAIRGVVGRSSVAVDGVINSSDPLAGTELTFKSEGPAIEELTGAIKQLDIRPGPYSLGATLSLANDAIRFDDIDYSRERGQIQGDLRLAFPESGIEADFDLQASGGDLQSLVGKEGKVVIFEAPFSIDARGMLRGTRVSLDRLNLAVGEAKANASGDLSFGEMSRSTKFSVDINIPNLAALGSVNGRRMREQSLTLNANVDGGGGLLRIDDLTAKLGDSDIRGKLRFEKGDVPNLNVEVQSDSVRFAPLMEEQELEYDPTPVFDDGRLIPDIEIPFDRLRNLNARIRIDIGELQRDALHVTDLKTDLELLDGELTLHEFSVQPPAGWIQARGSLGPADGSGKATFSAAGRDVSFGMSKHNTDLKGRSNLEMNLESSGTNIRSLAANLDGVLFVHSTNIIVPENRFLKRLYGDMLTEIVSTINPFSKSSTNNLLDCVVLPLEITKGALITKPFALVLNSNARMVIKSSINLRTEKLSMSFNTTPRKGITISAGEILNPYVKVVGTLARPTLAVDEQGVLITGGVAVATGGLSILAKAAWQRLARDKEPCQTAVEQSLEAISSRFPDFTAPDGAQAN